MLPLFSLLLPHPALMQASLGQRHFLWDTKQKLGNAHTSVVFKQQLCSAKDLDCWSIWLPTLRLISDLQCWYSSNSIPQRITMHMKVQQMKLNSQKSTAVFFKENEGTFPGMIDFYQSYPHQKAC